MICTFTDFTPGITEFSLLLRTNTDFYGFHRRRRVGSGLKLRSSGKKLHYSGQYGVRLGRKLRYSGIDGWEVRQNCNYFGENCVTLGTNTTRTRMVLSLGRRVDV